MIGSIYSLLLSLTVLSIASALSHFQHAALDFALMGGRVSFFGQFDGISFYNTANASEFLDERSPGTFGVFVRNTTSTAVTVAATLDGQVSKALQLTKDTALLLGNFTLINGITAQAPVVYNVTLNLFSPIWSQTQRQDLQVQGLVFSALVDGSLVYLGGDFEFNNTRGVAVYNITSRTIQSTPFLGFGPNSVVNSIAKYGGNGSSDGSIVFGGNFDTLGFPELLLHNMTYNVTLDDSNSTSLVAAEPLVSLKYAIFSSVHGVSSNNDASLICPSLASTWSAQDNSGSQWAVELPVEMKGLTPTKVRIYLAADSPNGIKTFRLYTYPNNGIMNLTYVDPTTNELAFCDASCPLLLPDALKSVVATNKANNSMLSQNDTVHLDADGSFAIYYNPGKQSRNLGYGSNYQEFALVDSVSIDKVGLTSLAWYGNQAQFGGFELYLDQIRVYGNNTLNDSNCGTSDDSEGNRAQINSGNWQSVQQLNPGVTTKGYLVSVVQNGQEAGLTLYPKISYSGIYSLLLYTPGCSLDGSCDRRSIVNVTVVNANGTVVASKQIYQNNEGDKFDYLYYGHLNASSSEGQTQIRISFVSAVGSLKEAWIVVDKAVADIVLLDNYPTKNTSFDGTHSLSINGRRYGNGTNITKLFLLRMQLNGLFEYSLANFSSFDPTLVVAKSGNVSYVLPSNSYVGNSSINMLSNNLSDSSVTQILVNGNSLLILGLRKSSNVSLSNDSLVTLLLTGYNSTLNETEVGSLARRNFKRDQTIMGYDFNNSISYLAVYGSATILTGQFSISGDILNLAANNASTQSANNFAVYDGGKIYSFGNSYFDADFSQVVFLAVNGTEYFVFSSANGIYKTWDNTRHVWLSNHNVFNISSGTPLGDLQLVAGQSFVVMSATALGAGYASAGGLSNYSFGIAQGTILKSFYVNSSYAVVGGNFQSGARSDNASSQNIAVIHNDILTQIYHGAEWGNNSMVTSLFVDPDDGFLYSGANGSVQISGLSITGLSVYSLRNNTLAPVQPPDLSTVNGLAISVNALAIYENNKHLLVGGRFDRAGSLDCGVVCIYDTVNTRWLSPQSGSNAFALGGVVTDAKFISSSDVLLSGALSFNGTQVNFITYNFVTGSFSSPPASLASVGVNQTVDKFLINDNNAQMKSRMVAMGSNFVAGFDGSSWARIDSGISITDKTIFSDLKLVQLSSKTASRTQVYFNSDKALMLSGLFNISGYGNVNMALFDGVSWTPYIFTLNNCRLGVVESVSLQDIYRLQSSNDIKSNRKHMSTKQVVGVSLACALALTAFLGLLYTIPLLFLLRDSKIKEALRKRINEDEMMHVVDPSDLLHEMDLQRNY